MDAVIEHQTLLRTSFSFGGLFLFWSLALAFPYRKNQGLKNKKRWITNLVLNFGNGLMVFLITPLSLVQISSLDSFRAYNIISLNDGSLFKIVLAVIIFDLAIYWQHRLTHKIPILWRLHRVHHSDIEFDTTTAGRFHAIEILLSYFLKALIIILLGLPAVAIIIFEILLNFSALFNHSNFHFPKRWEGLLKYLVITPDLHRIHHSTVHNEMNCNFGFSISLWDRLFKSYKEISRDNPQTMDIGLKQFRSSQEQGLLSLLKQPFLKE